MAGPTGPQGLQGVPGPEGTARAYAVVIPSGPPTLLGPRNITGVSAPAGTEGVYCLAVASSINASAETVAVSPEVSYSGGKAGVIAVNAQHQHCQASEFEVDTYATPGVTQTVGGFAFTIVVP